MINNIGVFLLEFFFFKISNFVPIPPPGISSTGLEPPAGVRHEETVIGGGAV